jgi:hypothetical protein
MSIARSDKAVALEEALHDADIDVAYGSEGEGWDFDIMARCIEQAGWKWTRDDSRKVSTREEARRMTARAMRNYGEALGRLRDL